MFNIFSSPASKVLVRYCNHSASAIVGRHHRLQPQTFNIQSISHKPLAQLEENLVEMLLGWWPAFSMIFVSFGKSTWLL
jgi:hypothetical protein